MNKLLKKVIKRTSENKNKRINYKMSLTGNGTARSIRKNWIIKRFMEKKVCRRTDIKSKEKKRNVERRINAYKTVKYKN